MIKPSGTVICVALGVALLAGCSSNTGLFGDSLTTQSIGMAQSGPAGTTPTTVANRVDPACYSISQRIDTLRREGVTERIEKASVGKSNTVSVKRASLAQAAELDKANAEFQAKCSTLGARPIQAAAASPIATGSVTAAATPASTGQVVSASAPVAPPVVVQQR